MTSYIFPPCSPDQNTRINVVILDLSYPKGQSLNDQVDRHLFNRLVFSLKFPSVDNIVKEIVTHGNDVTLAKIDVARAFGNLHVDPVRYMKLQFLTLQ